VTPPNRPYPPRHGRHRPDIVGNGTDFSAEVANFISSAKGSFDSVTGLTSETGTTFGLNCSNPVTTANTFSLQLNTKPFTTSVCSGSPNQGCQGWQQFVYSNQGVAFIQYWLLQYNTTCPAGWNTFSFPGSTDIYCWKNGPNGVSVPVQTITNLASLSVTGTANSGGADTVIIGPASGNLHAANQDSTLNLAAGWNAVEFVVCGDGCSSQANFNTGSTVAVRTTVDDGTTNPPSCLPEGFTGETNNLALVQPSPSVPQAANCCRYGGALPNIQFMESNASGATATGCGPNSPTNLNITVH